jgi:pseudouridine synthase
MVLGPLLVLLVLLLLAYCSCVEAFAMTITKLFKYHKPVGVLSTTFRDIGGNIIDKGQLSIENRKLLLAGTPRGPIVPIGRLDKDSSGLLLLTNSQQIIARLLRTLSDDTVDMHQTSEESDDDAETATYGSKYEKEYEVTTSWRFSDEQLESLRHGVVISTMARNRSGLKNTRPTLPIGLERIAEDNVLTSDPNFLAKSRKLLFTLREGRNRQIRKMVGKYGNAVVELKRTAFGGITLDGIGEPGDLLPLNQDELLKLGIKKLI